MGSRGDMEADNTTWFALLLLWLVIVAAQLSEIKDAIRNSRKSEDEKEKGDVTNGTQGTDGTYGSRTEDGERGKSKAEMGNHKAMNVTKGQD
jgi:hypothetical protein